MYATLSLSNMSIQLSEDLVKKYEKEQKAILFANVLSDNLHGILNRIIRG